MPQAQDKAWVLPALSLVSTLVSLFQLERGQGCLFQSQWLYPLIPAEAGAACSWEECGGGRITCCEQHFCPAPALGLEDGSIGKPLILLLAAFVW